MASTSLPQKHPSIHRLAALRVHVKLTGNPKLSVGVNVWSVDGCLSLLDP